MNTSDGQTLRKAGELGWHASRYNIAARVPGTPMTAIYNTFKRTCGEYNPLEVYLLSVIEDLDEDHAIIERFAMRGVIANCDEREAFEMQRMLECATAQGVCLWHGTRLGPGKTAGDCEQSRHAQQVPQYGCPSAR